MNDAEHDQDDEFVTCPTCSFQQKKSDATAATNPADALEAREDTIQMDMSAEMLAQAMQQIKEELPSDKEQEEENEDESSVEDVLSGVDLDEAFPLGDDTQTDALDDLEPPADEDHLGSNETDQKLSSSWRLKTRSGLVLMFPSIKLLMDYAAGQNPQQIMLAHGDSPYRTYHAFMSRLDSGQDPEQAYLDMTEEDESRQTDAVADDADEGQANETAHDHSQGHESRDEAQGTRHRAAERSAPLTRPRPITQAGEFGFRKSGVSASSKRLRWAGTFLLGALVGGAVIYYLAWRGVLPFISY